MRSTIRSILSEERRLTLLRLLYEAPGCEASNRLLVRMLRALGEGATADQVDGDLAWLAEQNLIDVYEIENVRVCRLRARGTDVALGDATVPGVAHFRPER